MQTVSFGSLPRLQQHKSVSAHTRFGESAAETPQRGHSVAAHPSTSSSLANPTDEFESQAALEFQKELEARQQEAQGIVKGLVNGADVIFRNKEWRDQFKEAKAFQDGSQENVFDRLSSIYHLTLARFREAHPSKNDAINEAVKNDKPNQTSAAAVASQKQPPESVSTPESKQTEESPQPKPNPEAFRHYREVLVKYPSLALKDQETLPFDLGKQAAFNAKKPEKLLTLIQNKRNTFGKIQQQIQKEIENKKLQGDQAEEFQREQLKSNPTVTSTLRQLKQRFEYDTRF